MKALIFLGIGLLCTHLHAQSVFTTSAAIDSIPARIDPWPESGLKQVIPFRYTRITDLRADTGIIGLDKARFVRLQEENGNPSLTLQCIVNNVYKNVYAGNGDTLIVAIKKLMTATNMHYQKATWSYIVDITDGMRIEADFYTSGTGGYRLLGSFHYFDNPSPETSTKWHPVTGFDAREIASSWSNYLVALFDTAFAAAVKMSASPASDSSVYRTSIDELQQRHERLPVNIAATLNAGLYRTFAEFVANTPGIKLSGDDRAPADTTCWGFCDGEHVFIRRDDIFYQVDKYDGAWYLSASINALRKKTRKAAAETYSSPSLLRLLVHPAEGNKLSKDPTPLWMMRVQNKHIMALQLNYETGQPDF